MIPRYTTPEMAELWSDKSKFQAWLDVELAACQAWTEKGKIPADDMKAISEKAAFSVERIDELELTLHHDVIAFTTNLAENIGPSSRFVHLGLTSNDVVDTAQSIRLKKAGELILAEIDRLIPLLRTRAEEHKYTLQTGRTHGVHGEPVTLGLKFLIWYREMIRNRDRVAAAFTEVACAKISGAVGTFAHTGVWLEERVAEILDLQITPVSTQVLQRDRHAALVCSLAVLGATIEKIAVEIRNLQKTEVREVEEPFSKGQKGSSAMPHKRNPVKCEQLTGLARILRGNVVPALDNVALWHERDISHSSAERVILPDSTTLAHYMLRLLYKVIDGMHIYPETMKKNLDKTRGLLFSQKMLLTLIDLGMTREDAYAVVQPAAMATWANENSTFRENLKADPKFPKSITDEKLDEIMDYNSYLLHVDDIYKRALL